MSDLDGDILLGEDEEVAGGIVDLGDDDADTGDLDVESEFIDDEEEDPDDLGLDIGDPMD